MSARQGHLRQNARLRFLYRAEHAEDEKRQLIDTVRWRLGGGERIAILFPQQRQAYGYAKGLQEAGIDVENPKELDFTTDRPKVMPYPSAKGLTFDTVILPRLLPSAFGRMGASRIIRVLFVGITRATKWVHLSTVGEEDGFPPLSRIVAGVSDGRADDSGTWRRRVFLRLRRVTNLAMMCLICFSFGGIVVSE